MYFHSFDGSAAAAPDDECPEDSTPGPPGRRQPGVPGKPPGPGLANDLSAPVPQQLIPKGLPVDPEKLLEVVNGIRGQLNKDPSGKLSDPTAVLEKTKELHALLGKRTDGLSLTGNLRDQYQKLEGLDRKSVV